MSHKNYCFKEIDGKFLVFSAPGILNKQLTKYAKLLSQTVAKNTTRSYLRHVVAWINYLKQSQLTGFWLSEPESVRALIFKYCVEELNCKMKKVRGREGFVVVEKNTFTGRSSLTIAALSNLYEILIGLKMYVYKNPVKYWRGDVPVYGRRGIAMPAISGCVTVAKQKRLSGNFLIGSNNEWQPQTIDSPKLPALIIEGGRRAGWGLREEIVCRMLFETGGRISEVLGFKLGDWITRDCGAEAEVFSKGSEDTRVKTLRWSAKTTELLQLYFDSERRTLDQYNFSLSDYRATYDGNLFKNTPIFLNRYGRALSPESFRSLYWIPACKAANVKVRLHQARHWFVTFYIRNLFDKFGADNVMDEKIELGTAGLIAYMNWRGGRETLKAYNHFFQKQKMIELQDFVHSSIPFDTNDNSLPSQPPHALNDQLNLLRSSLKLEELK